jgi:hypothetical protein
MEYRALTESEAEQLSANRNRSYPPGWHTVFVERGAQFNPAQIYDSEFAGTVYIGAVREKKLKFHDLELDTGIYRSYIEDCVIGGDVCVRNVAYLKNYHIASNVILFNIQEMSATGHCKFGNGWLKKGEPESNRVWISVSNENDKRAVLPFESMIPADAWLWSRYREDEKLMGRLVELTEKGNDRELGTFGIVEEHAVVKNTALVKDAKIGAFAYIKGALKLKNITILSTREENSQIGEGVEMVNGIMGFGSKVFYQAAAVRFVIGRNCQLKYGARLLNSVLGDNSTVSCCELLNNLIFPFHEQHHNTSFLIACTLLGQSNIAAGATIGSNHNSRSPDGEIIAGRGFWPGLCSDFKHNSTFASFSLVSKGSYQRELNITYPFSLVSIEAGEKSVRVIPAYWFMYNMFAVARNSRKYASRDKRAKKIQHIETNPLAPDTMQEMLAALERIIALTAAELGGGAGYQAAKDYLHQNTDSDIVLFDSGAQKKYGAKVYKAARGYREYRKMIKYYAARALIEFCSASGGVSLNAEGVARILEIPLYTEWVNAGGQIIPAEKIDGLREEINAGAIDSWEGVHAFYDECAREYPALTARYAIYLLETLYSRPIAEFTDEIFDDIKNDVEAAAAYLSESSVESRKKDYDDFFRTITYRNESEMEKVLGSVESNDFIKQLKQEMLEFTQKLQTFFG